MVIYKIFRLNDIVSVYVLAVGNLLIKVVSLRYNSILSRIGEYLTNHYILMFL